MCNSCGRSCSGLPEINWHSSFCYGIKTWKITWPGFVYPPTPQQPGYKGKHRFQGYLEIKRTNVSLFVIPPRKSDRGIKFIRSFNLPLAKSSSLLGNEADVNVNLPPSSATAQSNVHPLNRPWKDQQDARLQQCRFHSRHPNSAGIAIPGLQVWEGFFSYRDHRIASGLNEMWSWQAKPTMWFSLRCFFLKLSPTLPSALLKRQSLHFSPSLPLIVLPDCN